MLGLETLETQLGNGWQRIRLFFLILRHVVGGVWGFRRRQGSEPGLLLGMGEERHGCCEGREAKLVLGRNNSKKMNGKRLKGDENDAGFGERPGMAEKCQKRLLKKVDWAWEGPLGQRDGAGLTT